MKIIKKANRKHEIEKKMYLFDSKLCSVFKLKLKRLLIKRNFKNARK